MSETVKIVPPQEQKTVGFDLLMMVTLAAAWISMWVWINNVIGTQIAG